MGKPSVNQVLMANTKKVILCWTVAFGSFVALAPPAHAVGEQYYLNCLRQHGLNVNDEKQALDIGEAIQHNGVNGVDPDITLNDLMHRFGQDSKTADAETVCAANTINMYQGVMASRPG